MICLSKKYLQNRYNKRCFKQLEEKGEYSSDILCLTPEIYKKITLKYNTPNIFIQIFSVLISLCIFIKNPQKRNKLEQLQCKHICSRCEFYIKDQGRCGICGCFIKLKTKAKIWKCPKNKWPE